jgi:Cytochrome bd terminal oxidase subunit I
MVLLAAAQGGAQVVPARAQMAATLGFHIILACLGIALPSIVLLAEFIGLRRHNETALLLARRWSQAMGVLIAVGAVTGTVLSFELGLLWPGLMRQYGAVLGFPFGVVRVGAGSAVRRGGAVLLPGGDLRRDSSSWRRSSPGSTCGAGGGCPAGRTSGPGCRSRSAGSSGRCRSSRSTRG